MPERIRVLLVDDHAMFRAGIKALLEAAGKVEVVGEDQRDGIGQIAELPISGLDGDRVPREGVAGLPHQPHPRFVTVAPASDVMLILGDAVDDDDQFVRVLAWVRLAGP